MVTLSIKTANQLFAKLIVHNKEVDGYTFRYDGPPLNSDNVVSFEENIQDMFFSDHPLFTEMNYAAGKAIFSSAQSIAGNLFVFFKSEKKFEDFEEKLLKIFARYIAVETERSEMEIQLKQDTEMKTLGMITSGVAHEVRNPLNAIVVVSEALFGKIGDNQEYQRHIHHIRNQVKRLTGLMQDLLNFGRPLNKENIQLLPISICISQSIDTWNKTSTQFPDRKVNVHIEKDTGQLLIRTDPPRFCQVIVNLLDNACYYSSDIGSVTIHVSARHDTQMIYLKVIDNGPGIEEKYLENFFKPFFSMRKDGTGLGTSIVKRLVLLHDGQISVYNNKSQPGLCVEICLPIVHTN
jgi:signal transduction histidine kinase